MEKQNRTHGNAEAERLRLQAALDEAAGVEERRRNGRFATPYALAREMVSYGLSLLDGREISFLDPAAGTGVFYSALLSECAARSVKPARAVGVESSEDVFAAASGLWRDSGLELVHADFTAARPSVKADLVVCNPPYVRHHYIGRERKERLAAEIRRETGLSVPGLSGLYCYFVLCAHKWLAPGAVCGWLVPSEFMDVNYGAVLKKYLLENVRLLRIHRYDPADLKFPDALVSSCAVWFRNERVSGDREAEFSYGGTHENPETSRKVSLRELEGCGKWTRIPEDGVLPVRDAAVPSVGDFFTVRRGLVTGANDFFILTKERIAGLGLDMSFFVPVLPCPRHLGTDEIFPDGDGRPLREPQRFLLSCTLPEDELRESHPAVWRYLDGGRDTVGRKYLCRNRKVWYFQEKRAAAPILCSYMGRQTAGRAAPFRFILNHTDAVATNSYLMLYPKGRLEEAAARSPEILREAWKALSGIDAADLEREGRVYGGGLRKIEPGELARVKCPRLAELLA